MNWISLEKERPEPHSKVLIAYGESKNVHIGIMDGEYRWAIYWHDGVSEEDKERPVTHWMPLPEPPKE